MVSIKLDETEITKVEEYKYLGQMVSFSDKTSKELKIRRANAWKAFWAQRKILLSKMKLSTKMRIFNSTILPIMSYGSQTWATTKKQLKKLNTTLHSMLRKILGIRLKDKVSLAKIRAKTKFKNITIITKKLKYLYAGHVQRSDEERWNKILTNWFPHTGGQGGGDPSLGRKTN